MKYLILFITVVFLTSCAAPQHYMPQHIQTDGEYRQESTGVVFPIHIQGFHRAEITKYDENETNVSVGYNHLEKQIALTLYSYPAPSVVSFGSPQNVIETAKQNLFLNEYAQYRDGILQVHQNSRLIADSDYKLIQGIMVYSGKHAQFSYNENFAGVHQEVFSELYLFQIGNTLFKYRIAYPVNADVGSDIFRFINGFALHDGV